MQRLLSFALLFSACLFAATSLGHAQTGADNLDLGFAKLRSRIAGGMPVRVAFLGGSVTAGATTVPLVGEGPAGLYDYSAYKANVHSFRALTFENLKDRFEVWPGQFTQKSCGLHGTDSELGNYRFADNVGAVDLLVAEFAINDRIRANLSLHQPGADRSIYRTMLGLVEQARAWNPDVAILLAVQPVRDFFTSTEAFHQDYLYSRSINRHFANDQRVPFVDLVDTFYFEPVPSAYDPARLYDGASTTSNYLHPSPVGHALIADTLTRTITDLIASPVVSFESVPALPDDLLPYPDQPDLLRAEALDALSGTDGWIARTNLEDWDQYPFYAWDDALFVTNPGDQLSVPFHGSSLGLWWEWSYGPAKLSGRVELWLDGSSLGIFSDSPQGNEKYLRRYLHLASGLDANEDHELVIRALDTQTGPLRMALHGIAVER